MAVPLIIGAASIAAPYVSNALRGNQKPPPTKSPIVDASQAAGGIYSQGITDQQNAAHWRNNAIHGMSPSANAAQAQQGQALQMYGAQMNGAVTPQQQAYSSNTLNGGQMAQSLAASTQGGGYGQAAAQRQGAGAASGAMQNGAAGLASLQAQDRTAGAAAYAQQAGQMRNDANTYAQNNANYMNAQMAQNSQNYQYFQGLGNQNYSNAANMIANTATSNADRYANAVTGNAANTIQANYQGQQQGQQVTGAVVGGINGISQIATQPSTSNGMTPTTPADPDMAWSGSGYY